MARFIFITGGVVSSLGKGLASAALGALLQALQQADSEGRKPTDEAQAMEWQGSEPLLVGGESTNIKVTTFADLRLVEGILQARSKGESP